MNTFKALKKEELKCMSDNKQTRIIKKGEAIFEEGERLKGVYCVRSGVSKLSKLSDNGRDQIVKLATKGEVLGQRSVIADGHTNLTATALEDMEVCFIPRAHISDPLRDNPLFTNAVLQQMAQDLKFADDTVVNMAQKSVKQRLAETLLYIQENFGKDDDGNLALQLTRADYADIVGTATELLIRTLAKFKKENLVELTGKKIRISNKRQLEAVAEGLD
jgi:CRP-like cAMP-binding protein